MPSSFEERFFSKKKRRLGVGGGRERERCKKKTIKQKEWRQTESMCITAS
jgi:hypothetical protein